MARPFPNTFEQDSSPLSPMSAGSQAPISYSANVNRKKTKKWVEAKPADYGGDDWGDDYDDEYAPASTSKPMEVRQVGQFAKPQSALLQGYGDSADGGVKKKAYGELPPLPLEAPTRSATGPVADRMSFIPGDEHRTFSGGYAPLAASTEPAAPSIESSANSTSGPFKSPTSSHPPPLQVSTQIPAVSGMKVTAQQDASFDDQPRQVEPQSGASSRYSETTKNSEVRTPASEIQARRDFSPTIVPSPLQGRYSPAPQSGATDSSASRFPPRKSSISQQVPPNIPDTSQPSEDASTYKPWIGGRSSSPGATARSPTATGKSIPFVRPADIYKRLEEEREKERQSLDSSRPSMDSIGGGKSSDRSASPASRAMREQSSFDNAGASSKRGPVYDSDGVSDHNRRLGPMLEPVKERKSEYGFDDYNPALATNAVEEKSQPALTSGLYGSHDSAEELRRFSTSPKLPDLNRISGFGIDLFSPSRLGDIDTSDSAPAVVPESSLVTNGADLRPQPSPGITSAVRQAFNAGNPSASETSVSIRSGIERTGSASTGTTGISPILSRVPTGAPPYTQNRESYAHENTTPSITEVDEPVLVQAPIDDTSQNVVLNHKNEEDSSQPNLRSGYRLDTINPKLSESAGSMPDAADTGRHAAAAEEPYLSENSDPGVSPLEEQLRVPSRPSAEREQSFRPALPGGWVSYATTNTELSSEREPIETQPPEPPNLQIESSNTPVSPISEEGDDDYDLTPTTTKKPLRQSALSAAAEAAFGGITAADFDTQDRSSPSSPATITNEQSVRTIPGNSALPTPDPALAPIGNPYATSSLDPRLQAESRLNHQGLQPPQLFANQQPSPESSVPPTPPPKDTPDENHSGSNPDYFPPVVPLKQKTSDEVAAKEGLELPMRPSLLPTLSTQTSPQDETNDKLRKEIIKSLSPTASDAKASNRLSPPDISQHIPYEGFASSEARDSTYLPSEYDNYWESAEETENAPEKSIGKSARGEFESEPTKHFSAQSNPQDSTGTKITYAGVPLVAAALSSGGVEEPVGGKLMQRPSLYENRFSWEAGPEQVTPAEAARRQNELQSSPPGINISYAATPDTELRDLEKTREAYFERGSTTSSAVTPVDEPNMVNAPRVGSNLRASSTISDHSGSADHESSDNHSRNSATRTAAGTAGTAGVVAGAIAGVTAYIAEQGDRDAVAQRRPSLAEQKSPGNVTEYAVVPTPPEEEHPARASLPPVSAVATLSAPIQNAQSGSHSHVPAGTQRMSETAKIMQFRDIVALQQPEQRIRAFNDTRYQFAMMDTGLNDWIMVVSGNPQEPVGPASWGGSANPGNITPRSRAGKSGSPGGLGTPLQQPYYQQYLNATPASAPVTSRPGTGVTSGSHQGFSPNGGVQSKSKDSVHSTGIFGGKASKAKGLLAKGKMKFRGSGGGDKDSPPLEPSPAPKAKSADGRRTSWGLSMPSLTLSRSSIRADTASQHSRAETPTRQPAPQQSSGILAPVTANQSEPSLWDAPVSAASTPSIPHSTPQPPTNNEPPNTHNVRSSDQIHREEKEEERDSLGVPAPIGKYQPSWDPFNATPIVEEEGFQYDEQPRASKPLAKTVKNASHVGAPLRLGDSKSDRSTDEDAVFHDAPEKPSESEDWVLVSKDENFPPPTEPIRENERAISRTDQNNNGTKTSDTTASSVPLRPSQNPTQPQIATTIQPPLKQQAFAAPQATTPQSGGSGGLAGQQHAASQLGLKSHEQAAHNQQRAASQFPESPQNPTVYQQQEIYEPPPGPPPGFRPQAGHQYPAQSYFPNGSQIPPGSQPHPGYRPHGSQAPPEAPSPPASQSSAVPQGGFRGLFQHMRQKSSKDGNMPPPSQTSMAPATNPQPHTMNAPPRAVNMPEQGLEDENKDTQRQSADFVGLPMIRRSSTFGLGFGKKDPSRRFALDDDEDDPAFDPNRTAQTASEANKVKPLPDVDRKPPTTESAFGAAAVAAAVADRMYQPSVEPSRYSFDRESNLGARVTSDVNARHQGRSPIPQGGPPQTSRVPFQNNQPSMYNNRDYPLQQSYKSPDRNENEASRSDTRLSQESRPPLSTTNHPGRPSFEGQHMRSPSSSSQGYADTTPILGSGVYVPPPRPAAMQLKSMERPPSSAQRYPELFRADYDKDTSVDGLPANYYQAPVSREDAFLPRTQTNEYQLPGVGPPEDEPRTGRRSRRNSGLFKELGGRLSRSVSRDRGFGRDDDGRSPMTPGSAREIHGLDNSTPSIASEDMSETKKRRKSGLAFFGGSRRDSGGGASLTRENTGTISPVSRVDSAPQQYQGSPLANPNAKKSFFGNSRNAVDQRNPSKLSRVSTTEIPSEQQVKKKRFSGLTGMFSRSGAEQDTRRQSESAVQVAQDPRNYQNPNANPQGPRFPDPSMRQTNQDPRMFQSQPLPNTNGGLLNQQPMPGVYNQFQQRTPSLPNGGPGNWQPVPAGGQQRDPQRQSSAIGPEARPFQTLATSSSQTIQQQTRPVNESQPFQKPVSTLQSPQNYQEQTLGTTPRGPIYQQQMPSPSVFPVQNKQSVPPGQPGTFEGQNHSGPQVSQQLQPSVSPAQNRQSVSSSQPEVRGVQNPPGAQAAQQPLLPPSSAQSRQSIPLGSPGSPGAYGGQSLPGAQGVQQPQPSVSPAQNRQSVPLGQPGLYRGQNPLGAQGAQQPQTLIPPAQNSQSSPTTQPGAYSSQNLPGPQSAQQPQSSLLLAQNRQGVPFGQPGAYGGQNLHGAQHSQYQQQNSMNPNQVLPGSRVAPQILPANSPGARKIGDNQFPLQPNQQKSDTKHRQPSRLLSGIIGGLGGSKNKAVSQQPSGDGQQQQQQQQNQQQPQVRQQIPPTHSAFGQGHPMNQEPQYEPLPIPGGYSLVRGEGGYLAPTSYNPRGLNSQYGSEDSPQPVSGGRPQGYPQQLSQPPANQRTAEHTTSVPKAQGLPTVTVTAQNPNGDGRPSLDSRQSSQDPRRASRQLSSEDILARSPARAQFDQQAPYKLSLPDDAQREKAGEKSLLADRNLALERQSLSGEKVQSGMTVPTEINMPTERTLPAVAAINTNTLLTRPTQPALRHPQSPATYPLPQDSPFSPVNPSASQVPPPPPPQWPQEAVPTQSLDRSNTINTYASEVSQLSGNLSVPEASKEPESGQPASVTPPSPQLTPQRMPERSSARPRAAVAARKVSDDDVYNATPKNSNSPTRQEPFVSGRAPQMSPEKIVVENGMGPPQRMRRTSQEEKILVEDGTVRPESVEEDLPSMSATSYPGMEWNPYGAAEYQDWD